MSEAEKPIGAATDFSHLTPFEREKRMAAARAGIDGDPEAAFRLEMQQAEKERARIAQQLAAREKFLNGETDAAGQPKPPSRTYFLLVSKLNGKFQVVGMYSDREKLAQALADGVAMYASAGAVLGVVDFNLAVKVDQPPTPPA